MKATIRKWMLTALACCSTFLFAFGVSVLAQPVTAIAEETPQEAVVSEEEIALSSANYFIRSVSLRLPKGFEGHGIRFKTVVESTAFDALFCDETKVINVTTGTLILPAALLPDGEELDVNTESVMNINTTDYWMNVEYDGVSYKESCAYLYDIPAENFGTRLVVRSYVQFANGEVEYTNGLKYLDAANTPITLSNVAVKASNQSTSETEKESLRETYLKRTLTLHGKDENGSPVEYTQDIYYGEAVNIAGETTIPDVRGQKITAWTNSSGSATFTYFGDSNYKVSGNMNLYAQYEENYTPVYPSDAVPTSVLSDSAPTFTMSESQTAGVDNWEFVQVAFDGSKNFYARDYLAVQMKMITKQAGLTVGLLDGDRYSTAAAASNGNPVYFWKENGEVVDLTITNNAIRLLPDYGAGILLIPISSLSWQFEEVKDGDLKDVKHLFFTATTQHDYGYAFQVGEVGVYRGDPFSGHEYESLFTAQKGAKPNAYYADSLNSSCFSMPYTTPQRTDGAYKNAAIWDTTDFTAGSTAENWQRMYVEFDETFDATDMRYMVAEYYIAGGVGNVSPGITFGIHSGIETRYSTAVESVESRRVYGLVEGESKLKVVGLIKYGALTLDKSYLNKKITLVLPDYLFVHQYGTTGTLSSIDSFVMTTNSFYNWNYKVILGEVGYVDDAGSYHSLLLPTPKTNADGVCRIASDKEGELAKLSYVGDISTMTAADVLFMGDSYMDFWDEDVNKDDNVVTNSFAAMTADVGLSSGRMLGAAGSQTGDWTGSLIDEYAAKYSPRKIVFHIGVNDVDDAGQTADETATNLKNLYAAYHEAFPLTELYWVSLIPNTTFAANNPAYYSVNSQMQDYAKENDWFNYIDVWNAFCQDGYNGDNGSDIKPRLSMFRIGDGLHLNLEYGYPLWGGIVLNEMGYTRVKGDGVLGDSVDGKYYYTPGWDLAPDGENQAVNYGTTESIIYYNAVEPSENIYFEINLKAADQTGEDEYPKAGVMLRNDDLSIFAFFDLHDVEGDSYIGDVDLVYRANSSDGYPYNWDWDYVELHLGERVSLGSDYDIRTDYRNIGIAKVGAVIYVLIDGNVVASRDFEERGLTAESKMTAGVVGFNLKMEVKNANGTNVESEVRYQIGERTVDKSAVSNSDQLNILKDGVAIGTSVQKNDVVTFTVKDGYVLGALYANDTLITPNASGVYSLTVTENTVITGEVYQVINGVVLDGIAENNVYQGAAQVASYSEDRSITVNAVKTADGVFIQVKTIADGYKVDSDYWYENTNFEFYLGGGVQRYVNINGASYGVSNFKWITRTPTETGTEKYEYLVELFVAKADVPEWSDNDALQFNYAWKTKGEKAYVIGDIVHPHSVTATDWWAGHKVGGAWWSAADSITLQNTLCVSSNGLAEVKKDEPKKATIDGVLSESIYDKSYLLAAGDSAKATVVVVGKAENEDGLYLGIEITHGAWSEPDYGEWAYNDNIELRINGENTGLLFLNGEMKVPAFITQAAQNTTVVNGKNVTTVELFVAGTASEYTVWIGCNGTGFGANANPESPADCWQPFYWGNGQGDEKVNYLTVTTSGIEHGTNSEAIVDGNFAETLWTDTVKSKTFTTTANGATVTMMGFSTSYGVMLGFTVLHTVPVTTRCQGGNDVDWWNFMGPEVRVNGNTMMQIAASCKAEIGCKAAYQTTGTEGAYTTTWEMFIPYATGNVALSVAGVYETGFAWLWGSNGWMTTHYVTADGIVSAIDGSFGDAVWSNNTQAAKTTTVNDATVELIGVKTGGGILLGLTVTHAKATTEVVRLKDGSTTEKEDGSLWWHYMGPEICVGYVDDAGVGIIDWDTQIVATTFNTLFVQNCTAAYQTTGTEGAYTTTWEIFVPYVTAQNVALVIGGNYEKGFAWLWGSDEKPFTVTANGIV